MMTEETVKESVQPNLTVSPDTIVNVIAEGAEIYSSVTTSFIQKFVFYEKTLYEWASHLMIEIPDKDVDEIVFRNLLYKLINNLQIASNYYSVASSMCDAVSGGNSIKKSDIVAAIVANYATKGAKRPAASVIDQMAESYMSSTISARVAARIVKSFWKQRMDTLSEIRKILEQVGMSLHMEMKWTSQ
jgi:hypothetical protein